MPFRFIQSEIFTGLLFNHEPSLGEVVKEIGWGSNRDVRQRGFRIDPSFSEKAPFFSAPVKELPVAKDPNLKLEDNWAVMPPNGKKLVVIQIKLDMDKS